MGIFAKIRAEDGGSHFRAVAFTELAQKRPRRPLCRVAVPEIQVSRLLQVADLPVAGLQQHGIAVVQIGDHDLPVYGDPLPRAAAEAHGGQNRRHGRGQAVERLLKIQAHLLRLLVQLPCGL